MLALDLTMTRRPGDLETRKEKETACRLSVSPYPPVADADGSEAAYCVRGSFSADCVRNSRRGGFTLIEMLIVVSILLIITVAVVAVAPRFNDDRKLARAADQIAQILLTTKQRSKRDQVPTGVRLFPDPQHPGLITELQYIQQPDDFAPTGSTVTLTYVPNSLGIVSNLPPGTNWPPASWPGSVLVAQGTGLLDFTGGFSNPALWPVQPGDHLNVKGTIHQILAVFPLVVGPPTVPSTLVLAPVAPFQPRSSIGLPAGNTLPITASGNTAQIIAGMIVTAPWGDNTTKVTQVNNTSPPGFQSITLSAVVGGGDWIGFLPAVSGRPTSYNIIRQPRVLTGETPLQLPTGICIDPSAKFPGDTNGFNPPLDIMFSPQGTVLNLHGTDQVILWVRDYTKDASARGDQFLIQIQTHTGFIAEHPVDTGSNDPYRFTKDARSSGM